jgi:hypothetical protein
VRCTPGLCRCALSTRTLLLHVAHQDFVVCMLSTRTLSLRTSPTTCANIRIMSTALGMGALGMRVAAEMDA